MSLPLEARGDLARLSHARDHLRHTIAPVPDIFAAPTEVWFRQTARGLFGARRALRSAPDETRRYLEPIIDTALKYLRDDQHIEPLETDDKRALRADIRITELSLKMANNFRFETAPIPGKFIDIDSLVNEHPDQMRRSVEYRHGIKFDLLGLRNPITGIWYDLPLPLSDHMLLKGGPARIVLDMHAGAPVSMLASELPWNDLDVISAQDEETARREADLMGVDPQGVEMKKGGLDIGSFFASRDTTQNMVALGRNGLYYSDNAYLAATTGHIEIASAPLPEKALYGTDSFLHSEPSVDGDMEERILLPKQRGQMRLIKAVAEGKARSFDHAPITANLDFGIYAVFLAKRWANKTNFPLLMQRMFYLLQQTEQVRADEGNVMDLLNRVHRDYPFFDFGNCISTMPEVIKWKAKKLIGQIDRGFRWTHKLPPTIEFQRKPGDTTPKKVSLEGFTYSEDEAERFLVWWPKFLEESNQRTREYNELEHSPEGRYFYSQSPETPMESCAS